MRILATMWSRETNFLRTAHVCVNAYFVYTNLAPRKFDLMACVLTEPFEAHNAPSDCDSALSEQTRAHMNQPTHQNIYFVCVFWERCFDYFPIGCTTIFILRFSIEVAWSTISQDYIQQQYPRQDYLHMARTLWGQHSDWF